MGAVFLCSKRKWLDMRSMSVKDEIKQAIKISVQKEIQKLKSKMTRDEVAVVMEIKGDKYRVDINGYSYWIKDGVGIVLSVGTGVWIRIPEGNMSFAYICAKR